MILSLATLDKVGRDLVIDMSLGYERDAREGVALEEQLGRLQRWYRDGWPLVQYHYHVLAAIIGYAAAERQCYTIELPGFGGC
jgi:hypothetical protein